MTGARILLIEDDERIGSTLERALGSSGYEVAWFRTGLEGVHDAGVEPPDLVLLDLGLPDIDGLDACRRIHGALPSVPVMMLTARDEELDVVVGLDAGAIDYVTKPFKLAELLARIRAQLRHREVPVGVTGDADLRLDAAARRVWLRGTEMALRPKEFDLLARLMADVWDEHWFGSTKTLDFHIAALRRKLDDDGTDSRITTLRGVGYRLEVR